jgi:hypothetical protein
MDAPTALDHPEGRVVVQELGSGLERVTVELFDPAAYVSEWEFQTAYPLADRGDPRAARAGNARLSPAVRIPRRGAGAFPAVGTLNT